MSNRVWGWLFLTGVVYYPVRTGFLLSRETSLTFDEKFFVAIMAGATAVACIKWAADEFAKTRE